MFVRRLTLVQTGTRTDLYGGWNSEVRAISVQPDGVSRVRCVAELQSDTENPTFTVTRALHTTHEIERNW